MRIGIVGTGDVPVALGRLWLRAGHEVFLGAARPEAMDRHGRGGSPRAHVGSLAEAAEFGDVILFAPVPRSMDATLEATGPMALRIVIDATGHFEPGADGALSHALGPVKTTCRALARRLPDATVVKAFSTLSRGLLEEMLRREGFPPLEDRVAVFHAGDDRNANDVVGRLISDAGFADVGIGTLEDAALLEFGGPLWGKAPPIAVARRLLAAARVCAAPASEPAKGVRG